MYKMLPKWLQGFTIFFNKKIRPIETDSILKIERFDKLLDLIFSKFSLLLMKIISTSIPLGKFV